eukprot:TRINITY_DN16748_c0_g2_i1.p3 TRINITY_DN16748_c0_g2~~TRINITY_DN16748_c0_g2_i1.p3  ORF type:complete len:196 (-),score=29.56 TRINITY_DN16748_c0_g2_i1:26-613(-)
MSERQVDMVRLSDKLDFREEDDKRNVSKVFPEESQKLKRKRIEEQLQTKQFISEAQLEENKQTRGSNVSDGSFSAQKPLAQILADQKALKEEEFQQKWKQMKQGKNRPLEEDEVEFLDNLHSQSRRQLAQIAQEEQSQLQMFKKARNEFFDSQQQDKKRKISKKDEVAPHQNKHKLKLNAFVRKTAEGKSEEFHQ